MMYSLIIIIVLIMIIGYFQNILKKYERFNNEALYTLTSLYTDKTRTINLNNLRIDGNIISEDATISNNLTVGGNIRGTIISEDATINNNLTVGGNTIISGNLNVTGEISGDLIKKGLRARYIRVGNNIPNYVSPMDFLTIGEIIVINDKNQNVAKNIVPTQVIGTELSSNDYPLKEATDGIIRDSTNFFHGNTGSNVIEIDLKEEYNIMRIIIFNRYGNTAPDRLNGSYIKFFDKNKNDIHTIFTGYWNDISLKEYEL